jgi:hypothetical protein
VALVVALAACRREDAVPSAPVPMAAVPVVRVAPQAPAALTHVTIKALGMYCEESCPMRVRLALADIPSVYELGFDLTHESVFISYDRSLGDPKSVTKPMLTAIKQAGFDPWLAKDEWPSDASAHVVMR